MLQSEANFKIPIALDDKGNLVKPSAARGDTAYSCPECAAKLIFRRGQIRAPHFSHPPAKNCTAESALHKAAKLAIKQVVDDWCQSGKEPTLVMTCTDCGQSITRPLSDVLSGDVGWTTLEHTLPSGHIADVALLKDHHVLLCVEILVTHRVDQHKAQTLKNEWLELRAETVIEDPTTWFLVQSSLTHPGCNSCARRQGEDARSQRKEQEDAERSFASAKASLAKAVERWLETEAATPRIFIHCQRCRKVCECAVSSLFPRPVTAWVADYKFRDGTIADLVLTDGDAPVMAIFIRARDSRPRRDAYSVSDLPWAELSEIRLASNPLAWSPITSSFEGMICVGCRATPTGGIDAIQKARQAIKASVESWLMSKSDSPTLMNKCSQCGRKHPQLLPHKVQRILDDSDFDDGLALVDGDGNKLLNIGFTEKLFIFPYVDPKKRQRSEVHWIQLNAYEALRDPMIWTPIDADLKSCFCKICRPGYQSKDLNPIEQ